MLQDSLGYDLIGLTSISIVILIFCILARLRPALAIILYVALIFRVLLIFIDYSLFKLPDSSSDSLYFQLLAYEWSNYGFLNVFKYYTGADSYFISWILAIVYSIFGQSELLGKSLSLLFGMGGVFLVWTIARKLWGQSVANKAGWVVALFPSLALYSSIILRESYIYFFLLFALNGCIDWNRKKNFKSLIPVLLGFICATFFHNIMIIGLIAFFFIVFFQQFKIVLLKFLNFKIIIKPLLIVLIIALIASVTILKEFRISKIGSITNETSFSELIIKKNLDYNLGEAKYPSWLVIRSEMELIYKSPLRIIYFLFSPFPWDIKKMSHLLGMLDGFLYIFLIYALLKNIKTIWEDSTLRMIFLILASYLFVFGISIGNFGTGLRHRSKFVAVIILLAAPLLPKIKIFLKSNKKTTRKSLK